MRESPGTTPPSGEAFAERTLQFPAQLGRLRDARRFVDEAAAAFGFGEGDRYAIRLAATEAITNAVQHGSAAEDDQVEVRAAREDDALVLYVSDTGRFVPRVSLPEELPERGRGLAFMTELMDEVEVRPGADGTVIRLLKRPSS